MKKVLSPILLFLFGAILTGGYFVWERYQKNPEQIVPYPYSFETSAPGLKPDAPILIAGDRMGYYFGKFSPQLASAISVNLEKPIRIQTIAREGHGLHRTIHELKGLSQWPQILIYQGASEEFIEAKFNPGEIAKIRTNFQRYQDDRLETLLILKPVLSRIIYEPLKQVILPAVPTPQDIEEGDYLKGLDTELMLFEQQLLQLVNMSKDKNSLLILTTTPINLDEKPRKVCSFTTTSEIEAEVIILRKMMDAGNLKGAFSLASKLITRYSANAEILYLHGQLAKKIGKIPEAVESLLAASAYDCVPWRATEVQNAIIRKIAGEQQILLFDFARLVEGDFQENTTFFDEIHAQNLYYEKAMEQLGMVIKSILKL